MKEDRKKLVEKIRKALYEHLTVDYETINECLEKLKK